MRHRLLWSMLAAGTVAVILLGVPLAAVVRAQFRTEALTGLQREAEQAQALLQSATSDAEAALMMDLYAEGSDLRITILDRNGEVVRDTGGLRAGTSLAGPGVQAALESRVARYADDGALVVAMPVRLNATTFVLRIERSDAVMQHRVRTAWVAIGGLGTTALAAAALLALALGRRLAQPLEELASSARRLGEGDFSERAPRSGIPESDEVASALDTTATRLAAALERSRSFGADASHQLRTPLTALRLDLEALEVIGQDESSAALVAAAVKEADRLEATIEELLTLAQPSAGEQLVDLGDLVSQRLDAWQSLARAQDRRVVLQHAVIPPVRARPAAIGQALQVLLDNALEHGAGTVTVSAQVLRHGTDADGTSREAVWARLCVADEGPGIDPGIAERVLQGTEPGRGPGRGLLLARALVEAEGGRLRIEPRQGGGMACVLLPAAAEDPGAPR